MGSSIFGRATRTDPRPCDGVETRFQFLNRVDQPYYARIRNLIDDWFSGFPEGPNKADLGARLRSDDVNHRAAFWELWLHEFLTRCGYSVEVHPECPDGVHRDFRVRTNEESFYLEAHCFFDSVEERGKARRLAMFKRDLAARMTLPRHLVRMLVHEVGPEAAPVRSLARHIQDASRTVAPRQFQPVASLDQRGWQITFWLYGIDAAAEPMLTTHIDITQSGVQSALAFHIQPLRDAITAKARRAQWLDLPYVVAINFCHATHYALRPIDLHQALVGTQTTVLGPDRRLEELRNNRDGVWVAGEDARTPSVSALVIAKDMAADYAASTLPTLYRHPFARLPLRTRIALPTAQFASDPDVEPTILEAPISAHDLFGLPGDWRRFGSEGEMGSPARDRGAASLTA
jgi:hypothetical protein